MPPLILTNELTASAFIPANSCLPREASSIGRLPCNKLKWIQQYRGSMATRIDSIYGRRGGSSLEGSARCYKMEPSGRK